MNAPKNNNRWVNIGIIAIIALLGVNAWLFYDKYKNEKTIASQQTDLDEAERLNVELEKQYYETLSQLEEMRGDNEEMNNLIEKQKAELGQQKDEIAQLIRTSKDYNSIKNKLKDLENQAANYLAELDALREQNQMLTAENTQLSADKRDLEENLAYKVKENEALSDDRTKLSSEKSRLESQNVVLNSKVNKASVVEIANIDVNGFKVSDSGKESKKRYANNIDRIKICFDAGANKVADPGQEIFYIRVISPIGQTIAVEDMGGGILNLADGDQVRFTTTASFDYNQEKVNKCAIWDPGMPLEKGNYQIEIYNKGHMAGIGTFKLK